jgi:hypothetical protein
VSYETTYLIVAGVAWLRLSRVELPDGTIDDTAWAVTFDGEPVVRRGPGEAFAFERGRVGDLDWELEWTELAPPFETPKGVLRRLAPTHLVTWPALAVTGRIGGRALDGAPGHRAQLWGKRHAKEWGWAHASTADGRWAHVLTASAPPLPRVSQHGRDGAPPGLPIARGSIAPPEVRVGPYRVSAPASSFIGLRYVDTDGSTVWCYHSERAVLSGAGVELPAALEIARRSPLAGWSEEP